MTSPNHSSAKELYARFHQLNTEVEELPEIAREKREKVEALLLHCFPWSYWYQMPWKHSLGIFLVLAGLDSLIIEAAKSDNPIIGGWSDIRMVQRYAHLSSEHLNVFADSLCQLKTVATFSATANTENKKAAIKLMITASMYFNFWCAWHDSNVRPPGS